MILFGSSIHERFCLDTVFVVASAARFSLSDSGHLDVPEIYRTATIESLQTWSKKADPHLVELTLFLGATVNEPVHGMFSFVPALPANTGRAASGDVRFRRPEYDDRSVAAHRFVNHASKQSPLGAKKLRPMHEVKLAWEVARQSILDAGLVLGVPATLPAWRSER